MATRDIAKESNDRLEALERCWEAAEQATEQVIQLLTKHLDQAIQLLDKHSASIHVLSEDPDIRQGQMSDHLDRIIALEDSVLTLSNEEGARINPVIAVFDTRLGQMQKAVDGIGELKSRLDDVWHCQLTKVRGDITSVQTSVDTLAGVTKEGVDQVHLRVDALISSKNQSTQTSVTLPPPPSIPPMSPPPEGVQDLVHTTMIPDSVVHTQSPHWDTMDARVNAAGDLYTHEMVHQSGSRTMPPPCHLLFPSAYDYDQGAADASSTGARLHPRSSTGHAFRDYARSPHNPDQYSAAWASRIGAAHLDPHACSPPNDPYY